jgi:hypothetical protein
LGIYRRLVGIVIIKIVVLQVMSTTVSEEVAKVVVRGSFKQVVKFRKQVVVSQGQS